MLLAFGLIAISTFLVVLVIGKRLLARQAALLSVEHMKARVGLENRYSESLKSKNTCWWCAFGRALGPQSEKELDQIRSYLISSGYRAERSLAAYFLLKYGFVLLVLFAGLAAWSWFQMKIELVIIMAAVSILIPEKILVQMGKSRLQKIKDALPDFLDMANICMNAGLSYLVALKRVTEELHEIHPEICYEFNHLLEQIQIGVPRYEALQQFAKRNPADEIQEFIQVLIQNEKLGSPIGVAINEFSRRMYQKRENLMEEKAAKTSAKMAIVIMPFLMLPYFVLMLGERMVMLSRMW